jgi:hypothetical protein
MTMSRVPRPAPACHSPIAAAFASLSIPQGKPKRSPISLRSGTSVNGMFTEETAVPAAWSIVDGTPRPSASTPSSTSPATTSPIAPTTSSSDDVGVGTSRSDSIFPDLSMIPAAILVPPRSTPMTRFAPTSARLR